MIRRTAKILAWTLGVLVAVVVIAGGAFVWRLTRGPIALAPLTPYVERALSDPDGRFATHIDSLALSLEREEGGAGPLRLDLRAHQVRAVNTEGGELAAVPDLGVGFSLPALLLGRLSPTRLELLHPRLHILRRADGGLSLDIRSTAEAVIESAPPDGPAGAAGADASKSGVGSGASSGGESPDVAVGLLESLTLPPDIERPLGLLRRLAIIDADLTVDNRMLGLSWHADRADVVLTRDGEEIAGGARIDLNLAGQRAELQASGRFRMADRRTDVDVRFQGVEPASLAGIGPALAPLAAVTVPVGGTVTATLDERFEPERIGFDLRGGAGTVDLPSLRPEPIRVASVRALGTLDVTGRRLTVETMDVAVEDRTLSGHGSLSEEGGHRTATAHLELGGADVRRATIDLDGVWRPGQGATVSARFDGLDPARQLAGLAPALAPLAAADLPLSGTVDLDLDAGGMPLSGRAALRAGKGRVVRSDLFGAPLDVTSAAVTLRGDRVAGTLDLERLALDLGGPTLDGKASVTKTDDRVAVEASVTAREVPLDELKRLWPEAVGKNAREWITANLSHGVVREATATVGGAGPLDNPDAFEPSHFNATIRGDNVTVDYFHPLPVVTGAALEATSDDKTFTIHTKGGRIGDIQVGDGTVVITGLDTGKEVMDVQIPLQGPVRSILTVIDSPPLGYPSRLDLAPSKTQGNAEATLHVHFPLLANLKVSDLMLDVAAKLRGVGIEKVAAGLNATDGDLSLALDMDGMRVKGTTKLDGIPVAVDWKERFSPGPKTPRTSVSVKGDIDVKDLKNHGIDLEDHASGAVGADILFTVDPRHRLGLTAALNLEKTRLAIAELGYEKKPGVPGTGKLALEFDKERVTRVSGLAIDAGGLSARATLDLAPQTMAVTHVALDRLTVGATDLTGDVTVRGGGQGYAGTLTGRGLDMRALIGGEKADGGQSDAKGAPKPPPSPQPPSSSNPGSVEDERKIPLDFTVRLDRVVFGDDRYLSNVQGHLARDERAWTALDVTAAAGKDGRLTVRYLPARAGDKAGPGGYRDVQITASDAGAVLRAMDLTDRVRGGTLSITGRTVEPRADAAVEGKVELTNYTLKDMPVLARILNAVSPSGLAELMGGGEGIRFGRLVGQYRKDGRLLTLKDMRTSGSALGLTLEGDLDLRTDTANLRGTIVPVYGLNRLIGQIPLLGDVLSGGEGQGIFSATWRVEGPMSDPDVSVNPLAVLAPGFLRNLFFLGDGGSTANTPAPAPDFPSNSHTK